MFPGSGASIDYNEAGEPIGWDYPGDDNGASAYYCDLCGFSHAGDCPDDRYDEDDEPDDLPMGPGLPIDDERDHAEEAYNRAILNGEIEP